MPENVNIPSVDLSKFKGYNLTASEIEEAGKAYMHALMHSMGEIPPFDPSKDDQTETVAMNLFTFYELVEDVARYASKNGYSEPVNHSAQKVLSKLETIKSDNLGSPVESLDAVCDNGDFMRVADVVRDDPKMDNLNLYKAQEGVRIYHQHSL